MTTNAKIEGAAVGAVAATAVALVLMSKDAIKAAQDGIRKGILSLDAEIHSNAVQCLLHAQEHGDTSLFRRLLVDVLDKTGYRKQGLIGWMRKHSPMELKGDTINLGGLIESDAQIVAMKKAFPDADHTLWTIGAKRPWLVNEANATPFYNDSTLNEAPIKALYAKTLLSPVDRMVKDITTAMENTVNGQPVDPSKPFFDGIHGDKLVDFAQKVKEMRDALPQDDTKDVRETQRRIAKDTAFVAQETEKLAAAG